MYQHLFEEFPVLDVDYLDSPFKAYPLSGPVSPPEATTFEFKDQATGRMVKAATRSALLKFANKVREAGGGTPLAALMPAVPQNEHQCLIARALNFSCKVGPERPGKGMPERFPSGAYRWIMDVTPENKAIEIAKKAGLDLRYSDGLQRLVLLLPEEIGNAARAFDQREAEFAGLTEAY